jgi:hypothetical protein
MMQEPVSGSIKLPQAKFDLLVNHAIHPTGPESATVVVKINGDSEEEADMMVTNETDSTVMLHKLSMFAYCLT